MNNFLTSWKSTVSQICTVILTVGVPVQLYLLQNPPANTGKTWQVVLSVVNAAVGISKLVVAAMTPDADKVLAQVPGKAEPQVVPAHPVPDNPTEKAVVPPGIQTVGGNTNGT